MILVSLFLIYIINTTTSAGKKKSLLSAYQKILLNHIQMLVITSSFDLEWPNAAMALFAIAKPVQTQNNSFFSIDCFFDTRKTDANDYTIRPIFNNLIIFSLLPIFFLVAVCTFWFIVNWLYTKLYFKVKQRIEAIK